MLKSKRFSNSFWAEAINTVVYLKNRSSTKYLEHETPFEAFYGFKRKVSHSKIFGCKAFAHIPKEDRRRLDAKPSNVFLLDITLIKKHIKCMIQVLTKSL